VRVDGGYRGTLQDWVWDYCRLILEQVLRPKGKKGFMVQAHCWGALADDPRSATAAGVRETSLVW
jgi:hypothetical protein